MVLAGKHLVLLDFDGVFVDSRPAVYTYMKHYNPDLGEEEHRKLFEGNIYETSRHITYGPNDEFWKNYEETLLKTPLIPGIAEVTKQLNEQYPLLVVSSSFSAPIRKYLESHDLAHYFAEIMGGDVHTSKIEKFKMIFQKYEVVPSDCAFVTDTLGDLIEASEAKVPTIAVTWGFHSLETLKRGTPSAISETPELLIQVIDRHFANS